MQRCHIHKIAVSKYSKSIACIFQFEKKKKWRGGGGGGGVERAEVKQELQVLYNLKNCKKPAVIGGELRIESIGLYN